MSRIEREQWLFQPPRYRHLENSERWHDSFWDAAKEATELTWDITSIYSIMSQAFVVGDRTLVQEVRRQPWMSHDESGRLAEIPQHGLKWATPGQIASGLRERLEDELESACRDFNEVWILLSGGLDSRIVAGVCSRLLHSGRIQKPPKTVTWGLEDSRDVHYAKLVAGKLGFSWKHLPLDETHLLDNTLNNAVQIGNLASPIHFHRMDWFASLPSDAMVLGGSYGDSVGRSEFSGRTVLELTSIGPRNRTPFLNPDFQHQAAEEMKQELANLQDRSGNCAKYVQFEHQQQGHYMRGHIAHVMNVINQSCRLYQAFTAPSVFSYMWSFHPAARTNEVYTHLLSQLGNGLVDVPWPRTNVAVNGSKQLSKRNLRASYHNYQNWTRNILSEQLLPSIEFLQELDWLNYKKTKSCLETICLKQDHRFGSEYNEFLIWLLSIKSFCDRCKQQPNMPGWQPRDSQLPEDRPSKLRLFSRRSKFVSKRLKSLRRYLLRRKSKLKFPPEY